MPQSFGDINKQPTSDPHC